MKGWAGLGSEALMLQKLTYPITTISSAIFGKRSLFEILYAILGNRMVWGFFFFFFFPNLLKKEILKLFSLLPKKEGKKNEREKSV